MANSISFGVQGQTFPVTGEKVGHLPFSVENNVKGATPMFIQKRMMYTWVKHSLLSLRTDDPNSIEAYQADQFGEASASFFDYIAIERYNPKFLQYMEEATEKWGVMWGDEPCGIPLDKFVEVWENRKVEKINLKTKEGKKCKYFHLWVEDMIEQARKLREQTSLEVYVSVH